jgi:glycosyltransferase involved in cell wall biosynthesis
MKFLFLSDVCFDNPLSGSEQVLHQQVIGLTKKNHSISAITRENGNSFKSGVSENNGILNAYYSIDLKQRSRIFLTLLKEPPKLFKKFIDKDQLVAAISHQPFTYFSLFIAGKVRNIPLIYVFHSPNHEEYMLSNVVLNDLARIPLIQLRRMIEKFCLKKAKRIMVLSQFMKQKVIDLHRISSDRIVVNPGGVDLDRFKPIENREMVKKALGFREKSIHLLTVRNLERRMGLDNLLRSIKILKQKMVKVHLTIGGEGPEKDGLQKLIERFGLMDEVTMTGFIPAEQLPKFYAAADFFILPTSDLEGFGLVTPESMACGTPVVGTPVGGTKEILSNFDYYLLCRDSSPEAIADGIQKSIKLYFNDRKIYKNLRMRCREYVKINYSWQRHINQLNTLINETLGSRHSKNLN